MNNFKFRPGDVVGYAGQIHLSASGINDKYPVTGVGEDTLDILMPRYDVNGRVVEYDEKTVPTAGFVLYCRTAPTESLSGDLWALGYSFTPAELEAKKRK